MGKRILLFVLTNLAIMLTISLVWMILGSLGYVPREGLGGLAVFCLVWGMGGSFLSLQISRWIAKRSMGIQLVDGRTGDATLDWLHETVRRHTQSKNLPMPEVGVYDSPEVNAFATGPSKARSLVAVSTGLLRNMRRNEAEAVIGHEIGHIANGDMVTMTLLQGIINAFVMFVARIVARAVSVAMSRGGEREGGGGSYMIYWVVTMVLEIVLGIIGAMVVAWFSRWREFRADRAGAELAGRENMVAALRRLMQTHELVDASNPQLANFKIAGRRGFLALFASHPPLEVRIQALESAR